MNDILTYLPKGVKASQMIQELISLVNDQAEQIRAQSEQIRTQAEQIRAQTEQIRAQTEEIRIHKEKLQRQTEEISKLLKTVEGLRDEINRLNKTPKRPKFRPNEMESRNRSKKQNKEQGADPASLPVNSTSIHKERLEVQISAENVPEGSRFKGYQRFTVQDVSLKAVETTYKLGVWLTPDGETIRAKLPAELQGKHFGANLRAFLLNLYSQGMTQPAIHALLVDLGIEISRATVNDILLGTSQSLHEASESILSAGLEEASFIRADDTGAKHRHKAGYCTHIGGEFFAHYTTTYSKSRENFLKILLQGKEGYRINEAMIWHLFQGGVEDSVLNALEEHQGKEYQSAKGLNRLLNQLGILGKKVRKQCLEAGIYPIKFKSWQTVECQ